FAPLRAAGIRRSSLTPGITRRAGAGGPRRGVQGDRPMPRKLVRAAFVLAAWLAVPIASHAHDAPRGFPPQTLHWELEGNAKPATYEGRPCLFMNGAAAVAKDLVMRDGVIDVDVATTATVRGFLGVQFRVTDDFENGECVYLRPHHSGAPDAVQYTPVLRSG